MGRQAYEYGIFEGDNLVAKGTAKFLYDQFNVVVHEYVYAKCLWRRKYSIRKLGLPTRNVVMQKGPMTNEQYAEQLASKILRLKYDGNVYASDPDIYRKDLNDAGIYFTYRPCMDGVGYILERC